MKKVKRRYDIYIVMKKVVLMVFVVIFALLFIRFVLGSPEDDWICQDGRWIRHGNPPAPIPEEGCK
jgi:hypothetical protein